MNKIECDRLLEAAKKLIGCEILITRGHAPKFIRKVKCKLLKVACICFKEAGHEEKCQPKAFLQDVETGEQYTWPLDLVISENI